MEIILFIKALILGVVEGLTEFLPVSSTGHLIVASNLLKFETTGEVFDITIQLGAILAIIFEYKNRFVHIISHIGKEPATNRFVLNLAIAFIPAAVVGLIFSNQIKHYLFNPISVATALVIGGFLILWIEKRQSRIKPKIKTVEQMRPVDALIVGMAQILALIPGTSRSGSTIMGGMLWGIERKTATEFSFFLAVPVMIAATGYDMLKHINEFTRNDLLLIAFGFVAAFISALIAVKALLRFVSHKNYIPFAWYRIIFGAIIILTWLTGWVKW
ncbi:MAG: undecaprenyl-diphosphate phosphatase [Snodgrassella sp.]|nr:undecaprenyl-diphosphate phosphatase [Snodgrassella sp.]